MTDTIAAVSSGQPPAAIAVIRVSGPAALATVTALAGTLPAPRTASLRALRDGQGALLDRVLVIIFPGPATATGEDLVELHCHGGRAVVAAVLAAVIARPGVRVAQPGEFTRRALMHGRIDLAEAEGLADLLSAETEAQRVAALAAAEGRVSRLVGGWMQDLAGLSARVEALLDYAEEDDVTDDAATLATIGDEARALAATIAAFVAAPPVERLHDGVSVVLAGPPNAGKSTLLNLLAERDAAIVSPIAGTTRDRIEATVTRAGRAYRLTDTAGLTATTDPVEAIGVARADEAIVAADLLVWLGDDAPPRSDALWIHTRSDLPDRRALPAGKAVSVARDDPASIDALWRLIAERCEAMLPRADAVPLKNHQRSACGNAASAILEPTSDPVILAENLRRALHELATVSGADATETMLDALFSRFCLGK